MADEGTPADSRTGAGGTHTASASLHIELQKKNTTIVVTPSEIYELRPDPPGNGLGPGFPDSGHTVEFADGRSVHTRNLWFFADNTEGLAPNAIVTPDPFYLSPPYESTTEPNQANLSQPPPLGSNAPAETLAWDDPRAIAFLKHRALSAAHDTKHHKPAPVVFADQQTPKTYRGSYQWANEKFLVMYDDLDFHEPHVVIHELNTPLLGPALKAMREATGQLAVTYPEQRIEREVILANHWHLGKTELDRQCADVLARLPAPLYRFSINDGEGHGIYHFSQAQAQARLAQAFPRAPAHTLLPEDTPIGHDDLETVLSHGSEIDMSLLTGVHPQIDRLINRHRGSTRLTDACNDLLNALPTPLHTYLVDDFGEIGSGVIVIAPTQAYAQTFSPYARSLPPGQTALCSDLGPTTPFDLADSIERTTVLHAYYHDISERFDDLYALARDIEHRTDDARERLIISELARTPLPAEPTPSQMEQKALAIARVHTQGEKDDYCVNTDHLFTSVNEQAASLRERRTTYANPQWAVETYHYEDGSTFAVASNLTELTGEKKQRILQRLMTTGAELEEFRQPNDATLALDAATVSAARTFSNQPIQSTQRTREHRSIANARQDRSIANLAREVLTQLTERQRADRLPLPMSARWNIFGTRGDYTPMLVANSPTLQVLGIPMRPDVTAAIAAGAAVEVVDIDPIIARLAFPSSTDPLETEPAPSLAGTLLQEHDPVLKDLRAVVAQIGEVQTRSGRDIDGLGRQETSNQRGLSL